MTLTLDEIARLNRVQTEDLRGPEGPRGERGPEGPEGESGPQGAVGPTGPAGDRGVGTQGPQGERGPEGAPGRDGDDAEGRVAITATDEPDYLPKKLVAGPNVTISEEGFGRYRWLRVSATAPVSFGGGGGFPGPPGPAGATGATGPAGNDGAVGATGPAGADAPSTLDVHLMGWDGGAWIPVLGDSTGRLMVTS